MSEETKVALEESIKSWEKKALTDNPSLELHSISDCALCAVNFKQTSRPCKGCPVSFETGYPGCADTPYETVIRQRNKYTAAVARKDAGKMKASLVAYRIAAQQEVDFLKSLREDEDDA